MLVLSRRIHEAVEFPGLGIKVKIVWIRGGVVRLGIEAPDDVRIVRDELPQTVTPPSDPLVVAETPKLQPA